MSATVHSIADAYPKPDAEKSAVTLNYEEMLAALNGLLAEMREERRQAEASGSFVDACVVSGLSPHETFRAYFGGEKVTRTCFGGLPHRAGIDVEIDCVAMFD
jgi:hypothetical protein